MNDDALTELLDRIGVPKHDGDALLKPYGRVKVLAADRDRLTTLVDTLSEALGPFVEWLDGMEWHENQSRDAVESGDGTYGFTYSDVGRARAALEAASQEAPNDE